MPNGYISMTVERPKILLLFIDYYIYSEGGRYIWEW